MSDLYDDDDILLWSKCHSELQRRLAAGEPVNKHPGWPKIIEEVESAGRSDLRAMRPLDVPRIYADASSAMPAIMHGQPSQPVSRPCPMTLDELLG